MQLKKLLENIKTCHCFKTYPIGFLKEKRIVTKSTHIFPPHLGIALSKDNTVKEYLFIYLQILIFQ